MRARSAGGGAAAGGTAAAPDGGGLRGWRAGAVACCNVGGLLPLTWMGVAPVVALCGGWSAWERWAVEQATACMFLVGAIAAVRYAASAGRVSGYGGRWADGVVGATVSSRAGWLVMESPAFVVPLLIAGVAPRPDAFRHLPNRVALGLLLLHYFHRSFVFPLRHRGSPMAVVNVFFAACFCAGNGAAQAAALARLDAVDAAPGVVLACAAVFVAGMCVNVHGDYTLIALRCPGESGKRVYRIPRGGLFEYVSGANFLGEIVEWAAFAALTGWQPQAVAFLCSTAGTIGIRALQVHRNYVERFDGRDGRELYPPGRAALIPLLL